jgi:hypothetical protein
MVFAGRISDFSQVYAFDTEGLQTDEVSRMKREASEKKH